MPISNRARHDSGWSLFYSHRLIWIGATAGNAHRSSTSDSQAQRQFRRVTIHKGEVKMKRSKLINVLVSGFFLSMVSIASVNTADADQYYNILGPNEDNPIDDVDSLSWLFILAAQPPDWNPTKIQVQVCHNDGQPITGIQVWYDGKMKYFNGWCDTFTLPFVPAFQFPLLEGAQGRDLMVRWWLEQ